MFNKAKVLVPAPEHAFWMDDAEMAAAPESRKGAFNNVRRGVRKCRPTGWCASSPAASSPRASGRRRPSVTRQGTPGSTWHPAGQDFSCIGDRTILPALFARNPGWAVTFDRAAEAARKVRRETFQRIVAGHSLVVGFHSPFPAFGRLAALGHGDGFQPVTAAA